MNEVHVCLSLSVNRNIHAVTAFLCEKQEQPSIKLESAQGVQTSAKAVSVSAGIIFQYGWELLKVGTFIGTRIRNSSQHPGHLLWNYMRKC